MKRNRRDILFKDEYGKNIVYDTGTYRISVDSPSDAERVILWHLKDDKWQKVGVLDTRKSELFNNFLDRNGYYLSVNHIDIISQHRGMGHAKRMYRALADFSSPQVKGIFSYLPNRSNKKQIPKIYKSFGAKTVDDYQYIDFED